MNKLIEDVIECTAKRFGFEATDILGRSRTQMLARARAVAMHEARMLGFSYVEIGKAFGRDHTTVSIACRAAEKTGSP